ncbi:MAG: DNA polymerase III subunit delta [Lachnospiraceae bacterium]|nr:DNA polymerase III subunit delta [Lachnospiraceae bacterium]
MAFQKKANPIECTRVIHDLIAKKEIKPCYLLCGEERYLVNQNKNNLMAFLNPDLDTMNVNRYIGAGVNVKEVIDAAETLPFFAEHRIIYMENSNLFNSGGDELAEYIKEAPETTVFVFVEQSVDGRSKLAKTVKKEGVYVEYLHQTEQTLMVWLKGKAKREGKNVMPSVLSAFIQRVGDNMQLLEQEFDKLLAYCLEKDEITIADMNQVCVTTLEDKVFEMIDAVSKKDQKKTLALYNDLLALKVAPPKILALLNGEFSRLLTMKQCFENRLTMGQVADKMGVKEFVVKVRMPILGKYKGEELRRCLEKGVLADQQFKEGKIADRLAVELLLIEYTSHEGEKA